MLQSIQYGRCKSFQEHASHSSGGTFQFIDIRQPIGANAQVVNHGSLMPGPLATPNNQDTSTT